MAHNAYFSYVTLRMAFTLYQSGHGHSHGGLSSHGHGHSHEKKRNHNHSANFHNLENQGHRKKKQENASVRAAFVHVIGDLLQSISVLVSALIIFFRVRGYTKHIHSSISLKLLSKQPWAWKRHTWTWNVFLKETLYLVAGVQDCRSYLHLSVLSVCPGHHNHHHEGHLGGLNGRYVHDPPSWG